MQFSSYGISNLNNSSKDDTIWDGVPTGSIIMSVITIFYLYIDKSMVFSLLKAKYYLLKLGQTIG